MVHAGLRDCIGGVWLRLIDYVARHRSGKDYGAGPGPSDDVPISTLVSRVDDELQRRLPRHSSSNKERAVNIDIEDPPPGVDRILYRKS